MPRMALWLAQPTDRGTTIIPDGVDPELEVQPGNTDFTSENCLVLPSGTFLLAANQEVGMDHQF